MSVGGYIPGDPVPTWRHHDECLISLDDVKAGPTETDAVTFQDATQRIIEARRDPRIAERVKAALEQLRQATQDITDHYGASGTVSASPDE